MRRPAYWLTIAFIFTVPWEAAIQLGELGRISRLLGLIAAGVWAISVVLRRRLRRPDAFVRAYFAFLLWSGLTIFWSVVPGTTAQGFITYTQIFAMILMIWDLIESEEQVSTALQAIVLGAYVSALSIIGSWLSTSDAAFQRRVNALGFKTDGIALIVALAIPAAWYLATRPEHLGRSKWITAVNLAYVPMALFAMTLTGTRGAAVASIPSVIFVIWTLRRTGASRRFTATVMISLGLAAVVALAPPQFVERITGSFGDLTGGDSLSGRTDIWADSLQTVYGHTFLGVGLDSHRAVSAFGKEAHNTPISVLVETGLVGLVLSGYLVAVVVGRLRRLSGWKAAYWRTQLAVAAIGSLSLSLEDSKLIWILATLTMVTAVAIERRPPEAKADEIVRHRPASRALAALENPANRGDA